MGEGTKEKHPHWGVIKVNKFLGSPPNVRKWIVLFVKEALSLALYCRGEIGGGGRIIMWN